MEPTKSGLSRNLGEYESKHNDKLPNLENKTNHQVDAEIAKKIFIPPNGDQAMVQSYRLADIREDTALPTQVFCENFMPTKYLDKHSLLMPLSSQTNTSTEKLPILPEELPLEHLFWYLSQAILQSKKSDGKKIDSDTQNLLDCLTLMAFRKVACIDEDSTREDIQTSPFYKQKYHREYNNTLLEKVNQEFIKYLGIGGWSANFITSPNIKEVFDREWDQYKSAHNVQIENLPDLKTQLHTLLAEYSEYARDCYPDVIPEPIYIDISNLIPKNATQEQIKSIINEIDLATHELAKDFPYASSSTYLMAFVEHEGQQIILSTSLDKESKDSIDGSIDLCMQRSGFRISPEQAILSLLKLNSFEKILNDLKLPSVELATPGKIFPDQDRGYPNWSAFLKTEAFNKFAELSENKNEPPFPSNPPYVTLLAKSSAKLLEGLKNYPIDQIFKDKEINDLLQVAYFVLTHAMGEAVLRRYDFFAFNNCIELINQMLQCILAISQPYSEKALEIALKEKLTLDKQEKLPDALPPIIPQPADQIYVNLRPSAMNAMACTLGAVEKQKGDNALGVMYLKDCYYEHLHNVRAKQYAHHMLDGSLYDSEGEHALEGIRKGSIDVYICEFHHNVSKQTKIYTQENVLEQVKSLFDKGVAADKLTVVIDNTIDLENSDNVRKFLYDPTIQNLIQEKRLNIVFLRSAQKFDMLGMDNYYGGISVTINNPEGFAQFNQRMQDEKDQLKGLNHQGLSHLHTYASEEIEAYRQTIIDNTQRLYRMLPKELIYSKSTDSPITISNIQDKMFPFIVLNTPPAQRGTQVMSPILEHVKMALNSYVKENNLLITERDSFGFVNANVTFIANNIMRLSLGLESEHDIQKYAQFFSILNDIISENMNHHDGQFDEHFFISEIQKRFNV